MSNTDTITLIIPQPSNKATKNKKKKHHYTKASFINSVVLEEKLEEMMDTELLYGASDFY